MKAETLLLGIGIGVIVVFVIAIIILILRRKGIIIIRSKTSEKRETVYAMRTNKSAPLTLVVVYRITKNDLVWYRCEHIVLNTRSSFERGKGFTAGEALDNDHTIDLGELEVLSRLDDLPVVATYETVDGRSKIVHAKLWAGKREESNMTLGALIRYMKKNDVEVSHEVLFAMNLQRTLKKTGTFSS